MLSRFIDYFLFLDYQNYLNGNGSEPLGCNTDHFSWCYDVPSTNIWLWFIMFGFGIGLGFPIINVTLSTILSHVIGPRNQARQISMYQMVQSVARLSGPIVIR